MKSFHLNFVILTLLSVISFGIFADFGASLSTSCPANLTLCNGTHCTDLNSDESSCGSCGYICSPGYSCINGTCMCLPGETSCTGRCLNVELDSNNCGNCNIVCFAGQLCVNGKCVCPAENILCNGICVDKDFDDNNCGSCGKACANGSFCSEGTCYLYSDVMV